MKRIIAFLLACFMTLSFAGCDEKPKNPKAADVMATITSKIKFPEMAEKTKEDIAAYGYDELNTDDIEDMAYIIAGSGLTAEEVFIVRLKDDSTAASVKTMMEARRDQIAETAVDYTPQEMEKINTAVIETKGKYALFAITPDNQTAKQIFNDSF